MNFQINPFTKKKTIKKKEVNYNFDKYKDIFTSNYNNIKDSIQTINIKSGSVKMSDISQAISLDGNNLKLVTNGIPNYVPTIMGFEVAKQWNQMGDTGKDFTELKFSEENLGSSGRNNPNSISDKSITYNIPINPKINENGPVNTSLGTVGVALNGVRLFNAYEDPNDTSAYGRIFSTCCGHPAQNGDYHYHQYPKCLKLLGQQWQSEKDVCDRIDNLVENNKSSPLIGFALDGFPIYGPVGLVEEKSKILQTSYTGPTNQAGNPTYVANSGDLDECNGREAPTPEFPEGIYHYVMTIKSENNKVRRYINPHFGYDIRSLLNKYNLISNEWDNDSYYINALKNGFTLNSTKKSYHTNTSTTSNNSSTSYNQSTRMESATNSTNQTTNIESTTNNEVAPNNELLDDESFNTVINSENNLIKDYNEETKEVLDKIGNEKITNVILFRRAKLVEEIDLEGIDSELKLISDINGSYFEKYFQIGIILNNKYIIDKKNEIRVIELPFQIKDEYDSKIDATKYVIIEEEDEEEDKNEENKEENKNEENKEEDKDKDEEENEEEENEEEENEFTVEFFKEAKYLEYAKLYDFEEITITELMDKTKESMKEEFFFNFDNSINNTQDFIGSLSETFKVNYDRYFILKGILDLFEQYESFQEDIVKYITKTEKRIKKNIQIKGVNSFNTFYDFILGMIDTLNKSNMSEIADEFNTLEIAFPYTILKYKGEATASSTSYQMPPSRQGGQMSRPGGSMSDRPPPPRGGMKNVILWKDLK